jgi:hypothetical protein
MPNITRFRFTPETPRAYINGALLLTYTAVDAIHGDAAMRLECRFAYDPDTKVVEIETDGVVGQHYARVFSSLMDHLAGEECYLRIERLTKPSGVAA